MAAATPETRAKAVHLFQTVGTAEAARQIGVTTRTITTWAKQAGVSSAERAKTVTHADEGRAAANEARRQRLRDKILAKAEDMLDRMDLPHHDYRTAGKNVEKEHWDQARSGDVKNYAIAFGVLLDKYRLEMGESTDRREVTISEAESAFDKAIKDLNGRLGANDK